MCLPVGCAKFFLKINTIILFLASCAGLGLGIYQLIQNNNDFWKASDYSFNDITSYLLLAFSLFLMIITIFGFFVAFKDTKQRCCTFLFTFGVIILFIAMLALAMGLSIYLSKIISRMDTIKKENCKESSCDDATKWICNSEKLIASIASNFGQNQNCVALSKDADFTTYLINKCGMNGEYINENGLAGVTNKNTNCYNKLSADNDAIFEIMKWIEQTLSCSGMCTKRHNYYFSPDYKSFKSSKDDLNKDDPTCIGEVKSFFKDNGELTYIIAYIVAAFLFLNIIFAFRKCCGSSDNANKNIYQRMSDAYN